MSAARHLSEGQLRMFIPAHELIDPSKTASFHLRYDPGATPESLQRQKVTESKTGLAENARTYSGHAIQSGHTLRDSIAREGIREPVHLYFPKPEEVPPNIPDAHLPELGEGHHRVYTAHDLDPNTEVPIHYKSTPWAYESE